MEWKQNNPDVSNTCICLHYYNHMSYALVTSYPALQWLAPLNKRPAMATGATCPFANSGTHSNLLGEKLLQFKPASTTTVILHPARVDREAQTSFRSGVRTILLKKYANGMCPYTMNLAYFSGGVQDAPKYGTDRMHSVS